ARDTKPLPTLGQTPKRLVQRPGFAAIVGEEEPARHRAGPQPAQYATRFEYPDLAERPGMRIVAGFRRFWRKGGNRNLVPPPRAVAPPQLGAEMAEVECSVDR